MSNCTVMTVESLLVCSPALKVNAVNVKLVDETSVIPVTLNVEASTVSSKVNSRISDVKFRLKLVKFGLVKSWSKPVTILAVSVLISTTELLFMSTNV